MGAATSSPFPLSESFIPFTSWSTVQMNDILLRYNEMDLDFGINMSEFMTLFDVDVRGPGRRPERPQRAA